MSIEQNQFEQHTKTHSIHYNPYRHRWGEAIQGLGGWVEIGSEQGKAMNKTHLEHTIIALVIQLCLWPFIGPLSSGLVALSILLGREIAQHEYKLALSRQWSFGQKKPIKWYEGITTGWSQDSILDVVVPAIACTIIAVISFM